MAELDSWEATLHLAWTYVKLDYDASIQARGILDPNDPQVEKDFVAVLMARPQVRKKMSKLFNVAKSEEVYMGSGEDLDAAWKETCRATAPAGFDATSGPPPGYFLVPAMMADTFTKAYQSRTGLAVIARQSADRRRERMMRSG